MSTTSSSATTTLYVNGKPAQDELARLRADLDKYKKQLLDIASDPSKGLGSKEWDDARKKLKATETELNRVTNNVSNVTRALSRLDKATPGELRKYLRQLKQELTGIERGSKAWDEHMKKIRAVQTEINKLNNEMKGHQSLWTRFADKMFAWGAALQTVLAGFTGLTFAARKAVNAYAEMDAEMASVRKFTGMTAEQVEDLNEEFKKIDTRTSREQLNQLAQEAGRLGLQSKEDVLGFVRAADQINVALDDLGEGATLTLSKLTDIFGDKERLGVEQSLLSVGSVINELSQNCTASAPYLAEFASRMGGVGAQAGMSIPQIMAFGAVLDSNNQKVEASSTALSQVITRLYQDPAKYARVAGLDVQKFAELMRTDANEAVLTLLESLNKAGGMDVLSPMFKDMGETGARAISALSTLAKHVDEVRIQQLNANQAFEEATSVTKEFNVQNNTVQAGLDKAKKHFNEMAVELGQKLAPAMKYAVTSSAAMMKGLSAVVSFISEYKRAIVNLAILITGYSLAVNAATIATKLHAAAVAAGKVILAGYHVIINIGTALHKAYTYAVGLARVGVILFKDGLVAARIAFAAMNAAMKTNVFGLIISVVTAAALAVYNFCSRTKELTKAEQELKQMNEELAETRKRYTDRLDTEKRKIQELVSVARDDKASMDNRQKAIAALNKIIPGYCAQLDAETGKYRENKQALDDYLVSLEKKIRLEANRAEYERLIKEDERLSREIYEGEQNSIAVVQGSVNTYGGGSYAMKAEVAHAWGAGMGPDGKIYSAPDSGTTKQKKAQRAAVRAQIQRLIDYAGKENLVSTNADEDGSVDVTNPPGGNPGTTTNRNGSGGSNSQEDKFAAEKLWRQKEEALTRIAYAKGLINYEDYTEQMSDIAQEFYQKQLAHTDLSENERLGITAQYAEEQKKQNDFYHKQQIKDEDQAYEELKAETMQDYLDGKLSKAAYDTQMENIEFAHLRALVNLAKEGTEERAKAEATYRQRLVADQQKRQQDYEAKEKAHQEKLKQMWDKYFVTDDETKQLQYNAALTLLDEVYKSELAKCAGNNEKKLELDKRYAKAKKKLYDEIFNNEKNDQKTWEQWIGSALDKIFGEGTWAKYGETVKQAFASMTSMMQSFNQLAQAEAEIKIARIEKQYDREISMAEGNNRKVRALERKKEKETARIKAEAQRKEFAQQVMNAISSTALAAINAYASASKIAWWLGPVAAGMALAAGAVQVAAIKKQQEASEAKGFAEGGFTPAGPKDKPVGVVHAGEWVASQKLLADPVARPMIDALDYAQRNNTLGSLRPADVSRSVTAPAVIAGAASDGQTEQLMVAVAAALGNYDGTMARLTDRLNEPFVTVNTVTGDMGIKEAQDEYQRLMNNTLPKSKRK